MSKPPLRISFCSNCGYLFVRSASTSRARTSRRAFEYEARRYVSWRSLFGNLHLRSSKDVPIPPSKPPDDEAKKRAQEVVRQLRERSERQATTDTTSHIHTQRSRQALKDLLLKDPTTKGTPASSAKFRPTEIPPKPPKNSISKAEVRYGTNPFLSPLQTEQREAMRKYLELAKSSKEDGVRREKYPWEEAPVPWNTSTDKLTAIRRLLRSRTLKTPSQLKAVPDSRKSVLSERMRPATEQIPTDSDISRAERSEQQLTSSKLYRHLQDHHIRSQIGYSGDGFEEARTADRELHRRIDVAFRQIDRIRSPDHEAWYQQFRSNMLESFDTASIETHTAIIGTPTLTPLIYYVMTREGFNSSLISSPITIPRQSAFDTYGCINSEMMRSVIDKVSHPRIELKDRRDGLIPHVIKRFEYAASEVQEPGDLSIISTVIFTPSSDYTFIRRGLVVSLQSGRVLFRTKEMVEFRTSDHEDRMPLRKISGGRFLASLDKMKNTFEESRRQARRLAEIYDF